MVKDPTAATTTFTVDTRRDHSELGWADAPATEGENITYIGAGHLE
ncbi:hypothetical protein OK016_19400 [Vibrio chagasii]|nr:hypothetical protein [Vibrio chagasii]